MLGGNNPHVGIKSDDFVVIIAHRGDTLESLAEQYLGSRTMAWRIADFNNIAQVVDGLEVVIPLKPHNPSAVYIDGYQTVPILCYHRFDDKHNKLSVNATKFAEQMAYLKENNYRVIHMKDLIGFLEGKNDIPKRAVVITVDDGYRSTFKNAYPILQKYNFPATVFLYTDFMGAPDALTWSQIQFMEKSGLIDFQAHSKTHPNMSLQQPGEAYKDYKQRIEEEIENPSNKIKAHLKKNLHTFAYPFGDTNEMIINKLKKIDYRLGVTVQPGSNAVFSYHYMLNRTMIFGDSTHEEFVNALDTFKQVSLQ